MYLNIGTVYHNIGTSTDLPHVTDTAPPMPNAIAVSSSVAFVGVKTSWTPQEDVALQLMQWNGVTTSVAMATREQLRTASDCQQHYSTLDAVKVIQETQRPGDAELHELIEAALGKEQAAGNAVSPVAATESDQQANSMDMVCAVPRPSDAVATMAGGSEELQPKATKRKRSVISDVKDFMLKHDEIIARVEKETAGTDARWR